MISVLIETIDNKNKCVLDNLMQAYEAEFSKITLKKPNAKGLFEVDTILSRVNKGYLLYDKLIPIGFAIKGSMDNIHDIAEFYIVPSYRNQNLGKKFAHNIFDKYIGKWQVRQIEGAHKAKIFWRKTIDEYTRGKFVEDFIKDDYWGKVTRQSFVN